MRCAVGRVRCLGTCQPPRLVLSTPGWLRARPLASLASSALSGVASCSWREKRCRGTWDLLLGELELAVTARPLGRGTLSTRCDFQVLEARAVNGTSAPARGSWVKVAAAGSERLPWPSASRALCTGEACGEGRGSRPRNGSKSASTAPRPRRIGRSQAIAKRARRPCGSSRSRYKRAELAKLLPGSHSRMPPASRLAARLADLSHAQLVEIAAAGCEASAEVKNRADALLAAHKPLAQWAVEGVLLSSDLVPHLLAPLQLEDGAAAAVCSRWAEGWKATSEGRRRLTRVALDFPQDLLGTRSLDMAVVPGGDEQLVVRSDTTVRILARDMSSCQQLRACRSTWLHRRQRGVHLRDRRWRHMPASLTTAPRSRATKIRTSASPTLCSRPVGCSSACSTMRSDDTQDEIVALDAQTLQPRHRFGLSLLNGARGMAVVGEELFVCDTGNDRLQVFSLAGEHRRSITGEWKRPQALCFVKDRLYLIEEADDDEDEEGELINPLQGRRIFVLSLQGDTLQVYTHPSRGKPSGRSLLL